MSAFRVEYVSPVTGNQHRTLAGTLAQANELAGILREEDYEVRVVEVIDPAQVEVTEIPDVGVPGPLRFATREEIARASRRRVEIGQVVLHRVARETGATVTVERTGPGSWIEQEPGYMTFCLNHSTCCLHETRKLAEAHAAEPSGWCGDCRRIVDGEAPRITEGKVE